MNIFRRFWDWTMGLDAPAMPEQSLVASTPMLGGHSQERYPDVNQRCTVEQDMRHEFVAGRICAANNANVTRHMGTHTVTLKTRPAALLTAEELADAEALILGPRRKHDDRSHHTQARL